MYELRTVDSLHRELKADTTVKAVSLCFDDCTNTDNNHFMIKSKSDGSLTLVTSCDISISTSGEASYAD
jgi:hypothetical protein